MRVGVGVLAAVLVFAALEAPLPAGQSGPSGQAADFTAEAEELEHEARRAWLREARSRWAAMSPAQRQQVRERYRQWRALPAETRQQVRQNFRRLIRSREGAVDATQRQRPERDGSGLRLRAPRELCGETRRRLERFADDPVYRHRLRRLDTDLGPGLRHDRALLERLRELEPHERRRILHKRHRQHERDALQRALTSIGVDESQAEAVHEIMRERVEREAELMRQVRAQRRELARESTARIAEVLGDEDAERARRLVMETLVPWRQRTRTAPPQAD